MATTAITSNGLHPIIIKPDGSNLQEALTASIALAQTKKEINLDAAIARRHLMVDVTKRLMVEGTDYGPIPGSDKPALLQPGADKLCNLFSLTIKYEILEHVKDWTGAEHGGEPFFYCEVRGYAERNDQIVGEGIGSCSSWEAKYRWRKSERKCPNCGKENIRKSRQGGGWYCWQKTGGCGATFRDGDQAIESQEVGRVRNPDVFDCVNTIQKIALKRCKISTTINATSASEFFTQDIEERQEPEQPEPPPPTAKPAQQPAPLAKVEPVAAVSPIRNEASRNSKPWQTFKEMLGRFQSLKESMPWPMYYAVLKAHGVEDANQFRLGQQDVALKCYRVLEAKVAEYQRKAADPTTFENFEATEGDWQ